MKQRNMLFMLFPLVVLLMFLSFIPSAISNAQIVVDNLW